MADLDTLSIGIVATDKKASTSIDKLVGKLTQLQTALNSVNTGKFSQQMAVFDKLGNVTANIRTMPTVTQSASSSIIRLGSAFKGTNKHALSLAATFGKLYANFFLIIRAARLLGQAINISSDLTEVQNVVDVAFADMKYKIEDFAATSRQQFGMTELQAKQFASRFQAMGSAMGITNDQVQQANEFLGDQGLTGAYANLGDSMADVSVTLTKLTADMGSFYNAEYADVAEDLQAILTGMARPLRTYGLDLTNATLQEWAMRNGIDADVKAMSQAEKTMLRYQYVLANTKNAQNDFSRTSQTFANQLRILKQNFQALGAVIGQGLIQFIKPGLIALNRAMNTIIGLVTKTINALGKIFGWQVEVSDVGMADDMEDYAGAASDAEDALGGAADNAKKLKDYTLGIDELNIFRPDEDSSGGGGGGGAGGGTGGGGAKGGELAIKQTGKGFLSDINTLYDLGKAITDWLADAMENIDWARIQAKAKRAAERFGDFLNGMFDNTRFFVDLGHTIAEALNTALIYADTLLNRIHWDIWGRNIGLMINEGIRTFNWDLLGQTIADGINAAVSLVLNIGQTINWTQLGTSIATSINSFFNTFDFKRLAQALNTWANGLLKAMIAALRTVRWRTIGEKIGEFLAEIDFGELLKNIGKLIWEAINAAIDTYKGMFDAAPVETALLTLAGLATLLKFKPIVQFAGAASDATGKTNGFASAINAIKGGLEGMSTAWESGGGVFGGLAGFFNGVSGSLSGFVKGFGSIVAGVLEIASVSGTVQDLMDGTITLGEGIGELVVAVGSASAAFSLLLGVPQGIIAAGVAAAIGAIAGLYDAVQEDIDTHAWEALGEAMTVPGGIPISDVTQAYVDLFGELQQGYEDVNDAAAGLEDAQGSVDDLSSRLENMFKQIDAGARLTDQKVTDIVGSFNRLLSESQGVLEQEYNVIMSDIVGPLGLASEETSEYVNAMNAVTEAYDSNVASIQERMDALTAEYDASEKTEEQTRAYISAISDLYTEYSNLNGNVTEYGDSVNILAEAINTANIDLSEWIDQNNNFDSGKMTEHLQLVASAWSDASKEVDDASFAMQTSISDYEQKASALGMNEEAASFKKLSKLETEQAKKAKTNLRKQYEEYGNTVQDAVLNKIPAVVDKAVANYESLGWFTKLFVSEETYVFDALQEYKNNVVDPITKELQTQYQNIGLDAEPYATEAAENIINALWANEDVVAASLRNGDGSEALVNGWNGVLDIVDEEVSKHATEVGKNVPEGYAQGIQDNISLVEDPAIELAETAVDATATAQESNSPSKVFEGLAKDAVDGYVNGFADTTGLPEAVAAMVQTAADAVTNNSTILTDALTALGETIFGESLPPFFGEERWEPLFAIFHEYLLTKFELFKATWIEFMDLWWEENVLPRFTAEVWEEGVYTPVADSYTLAMEKFREFWNTAMDAWWELEVLPRFESELWTEQFEHVHESAEAVFPTVRDVIVSMLEEAKNRGMEAINALSSALDELLVKMGQAIEQFSNMDSMELSFDSNGSGGFKTKITGFASGGFPTTGSLFIAGEAGAEFVGNVGGRTGVMNTDQMAASVAAGNAQVVQTLLQVVDAIMNKDVSVAIGDREIAMAANRGQSAIGRSIITG